MTARARRTTPRGVRRVLLLSDLHIGSSLAPCPLPFVNHEGVSVAPGPTMRWMNQAWDEMIAWARPLLPFHLVINGDIVEGMHHRTTQVWSHDPADHGKAAVQHLGPLAAMVTDAGGHIYVVRGTEAHTGSASENSIASELGAVPDRVNARAAFEMLRLRVCGTYCHFHHHMPTSARPWTSGTGPHVVAAMHKIESSDAGIAPPKVVCSAHRHRAGMSDDDTVLSIVTPAWQSATRFVHKVTVVLSVQAGANMLDWTDTPDDSIPNVRRFRRRLTLVEDTDADK